MNIGKAVDKRGGTTSDQSREFAKYIKNRRTELNITLSKADEVICNGTTNYSWFEGRPAGQRLPRKADYLKMKELLKLDDRYDSFMEETEREVIGRGKAGLTAGTIANFAGEKEFDLTKGTSEWEGWGTALKPAHEPICMARKPLSEKTVAENVLKYGTGGINIDESRVGTDGARFNGRNVDSDIYGKYGTDKPKEVYDYGRFPANLIHDNSEEVRECFPEQKSGARVRQEQKEDVYNAVGSKMKYTKECEASSGNASRFFKSIIYQAKASKSERGEGNNHPTVKPIALMEYLIKMITPKGGTVLDPFAGSGTTGVACKQNNFNFIGIEMEEEYIKIAEARINNMQTKLF